MGISSMSAGHCMAAKGIKGDFGAERAHDPPEMSNPSHHSLQPGIH